MGQKCILSPPNWKWRKGLWVNGCIYLNSFKLQWSQLFVALVLVHWVVGVNGAFSLLASFSTCPVLVRTWLVNWWNCTWFISSPSHNRYLHGRRLYDGVEELVVLCHLFGSDNLRLAGVALIVIQQGDKSCRHKHADLRSGFIYANKPRKDEPSHFFVLGSEHLAPHADMCKTKQQEAKQRVKVGRWLMNSGG